MSQRLDKWLVYARFVKHRSQAVALIEAGAVRLNKQRVVKSSQVVHYNDVLTLVLGATVKVVRVLAAAERRGPATVARQLYEDLTQAEKADASPGGLC